MRRYYRIVHWYVWIILCVMLTIGFSIALVLKQESPPVSQVISDSPQESHLTHEILTRL